jgi:hypothetical protein
MFAKIPHKLHATHGTMLLAISHSAKQSNNNWKTQHSRAKIVAKLGTLEQAWIENSAL